MVKKSILLSALLCGIAVAQEPKNLIAISVPVISVRGGGGDTFFVFIDRPFFEYDRSITDVLSLAGKLRLSIGSAGRGRSLTIFDAGIGVRFWPMESFKTLYLAPTVTFQILDAGDTLTSLIIGGEVGYRIMIGEAISFTLGGGPEIRFGDGPTMIGISAGFSFGYTF
jgi:hypothetical protein